MWKGKEGRRGGDGKRGEGAKTVMAVVMCLCLYIFVPMYVRVLGIDERHRRKSEEELHRNMEASRMHVFKRGDFGDERDFERGKSANIHIYVHTHKLINGKLQANKGVKC